MVQARGGEAIGDQECQESEKAETVDEEEVLRSEGQPLLSGQGRGLLRVLAGEQIEVAVVPEEREKELFIFVSCLRYDLRVALVMGFWRGGGILCDLEARVETDRRECPCAQDERGAPAARLLWWRR